MRIQENTFAAACYDQNSVAELEEALQNGPDQTEMEMWNLTGEEWKESIEQALSAKRADLEPTEFEKMFSVTLTADTLLKVAILALKNAQVHMTDGYEASPEVCASITRASIQEAMYLIKRAMNRL